MSAKFAVGSDFAGHTRYFCRKHAQLLNHRVYDVGRTQEFAFEGTPFHIEPHRLCEIALCNSSDGASHFRCRAQQIIHQRVDRNLHLAPGAARLVEPCAFAGLALFAYDSTQPLQFLTHLLVRGGNVVEGVRDLSGEADP